MTPTIDAPEANESLQRVIKTLRDLGSELNSVQANDSGARDQLEKTWLLREMISLPKVFPFGECPILKSFGD